MAGSGKVGVALGIGLLLGSAGGLVGGGALGLGKGRDAVVQTWMCTEAERCKETVALLEQVRAKDEAALEGLETHLDRHVWGLLPQSMEGITVDADTRRQLDEATEVVRSYRAAHPHPGTTPLGKDVAAFLSGRR